MLYAWHHLAEYRVPVYANKLLERTFVEQTFYMVSGYVGEKYGKANFETKDWI